MLFTQFSSSLVCDFVFYDVGKLQLKVIILYGSFYVGFCG